MNVYKGIGRRQIGGGIWATIQRGVRPILSKILSTVKPIAIDAGKHLGKSALTAGSDIAMNALSGKLTKQKLKDTINKEVNQLKSNAASKVSALKRRYLDIADQQGSGIPNKRRRVQTKSRTKPKPRAKPKTRAKSKPRKMVKRVNKRKACTNKRRGITNKRKRVNKRKPTKSRRKTYKRKSVKSKRRTVSKKAIRDIFG